MLSLCQSFLLCVVFLLCSCNGEHHSNENNRDVLIGDSSEIIPPENDWSLLFAANKRSQLPENVLCIYQDGDSNYWFGTDRDGVYFFDGKNLLQFTDEDGLSSDQVQSIAEDERGDIWFGTSGYGVTCFNGVTFTTLNDSASPVIMTTDSEKYWQTIEPTDLWFNAGGGAYRYDNNTLTYLPFPRAMGDASTPIGPKQGSAYAVYTILKDHYGNVWFGTQAMGVCRYFPGVPQHGHSHFTWFSQDGLAGPAVLAIFEDSKGIMWFGNNGGGLFRYDPVKDEFVNFTEKHDLGNPAFRKTGEEKPGTMERVWAINEDNESNLWIGTGHAGLWKYDGKDLINYTTEDGLTSDAINAICKDKHGTLWIATDKQMCTFNGESFAAVEFDENWE